MKFTQNLVKSLCITKFAQNITNEIHSKSSEFTLSTKTPFVVVVHGFFSMFFQHVFMRCQMNEPVLFCIYTDVIYKFVKKPLRNCRSWEAKKN